MTHQAKNTRDTTPRLCPLAFLVIVPEVRTTPSSAQKGLRSDQFLWEGTVEGVAREGVFVDIESNLKFALKAAEDVIKSNTTLPWGAHIGAYATHANETLLTDSRSACRASRDLSHSRVESACAIA